MKVTSQAALRLRDHREKARDLAIESVKTGKASQIDAFMEAGTKACLPRDVLLGMLNTLEERRDRTEEYEARDFDAEMEAMKSDRKAASDLKSRLDEEVKLAMEKAGEANERLNMLGGKINALMNEKTKAVNEHARFMQSTAAKDGDPYDWTNIELP